MDQSNTKQINGGNGKRPKIALFHYSGPPNISGVDVMMKDQARLFRVFNYKVEIVAGVARQFRKDIPVHAIVRMSPRHPLVFRVLGELEKGKVSRDFERLKTYLYRAIKRYIVQNDISVCILHNLMTRHYNLALTAALSELAADMPSVAFIAWVHDTVFYDDPYFHLPRTLATVYPWSLLATPVSNMHYVCVSEFLRHNLLAAFGSGAKDRVTVIPNVHDIPKFLGLSPVMRSFYDMINGLDADLIGLIPVRAVPRKNLEFGMRIIHAMIQRGVQVKLILTANIDYKREENKQYYAMLKKLTNDLGLSEHVFFMEEYFQSFQEHHHPSRIPIPEAYLISDFLLMTSTLEGFGLPLLEAGLLRCPIFASDIPPFREIGTTNINYFSLKDQPDRIAGFILDKLTRTPQAYFYRKIIKTYSMRKTFKTRIIPYIENILSSH